MNQKQIKKLISMIFSALKDKDLVKFKISEKEIYEKAEKIINLEFEKEKQLDLEVNQMMDDLEKKSPGSFQAYKMFPMLKRKLAEKKGIVL